MRGIRHLSISIARDWRDAYRFLSAPENFARWASGLGDSLRQVDGVWIAAGPEGPVEVRFAPPNDFGVLDHYVVPAPGVEVYVPLRVIANDKGCEVILTLIRMPEMSDAKFAADADWVMRDLRTLKALLEAMA